MDEEREQKIRERAYHLWEEAGRPEGREHEFWVRATQMHDGASSSNDDPGNDDSGRNEVDEASEESFPASDPPSFTPGVAGARGS